MPRIPIENVDRLRVAALAGAARVTVSFCRIRFCALPSAPVRTMRLRWRTRCCRRAAFSLLRGASLSPGYGPLGTGLWFLRFHRDNTQRRGLVDSPGIFAPAAVVRMSGRRPVNDVFQPDPTNLPAVRAGHRVWHFDVLTLMGNRSPCGRRDDYCSRRTLRRSCFGRGYGSVHAQPHDRQRQL